MNMDVAMTRYRRFFRVIVSSPRGQIDSSGSQFAIASMDPMFLGPFAVCLHDQMMIVLPADQSAEDGSRFPQPLAEAALVSTVAMLDSDLRIQDRAGLVAFEWSHRSSPLYTGFRGNSSGQGTNPCRPVTIAHRVGPACKLSCASAVTERPPPDRVRSRPVRPVPLLLMLFAFA